MVRYQPTKVSHKKDIYYEIEILDISSERNRNNNNWQGANMIAFDCEDAESLMN